MVKRSLCQWKGVEIIEGEICSDHVHLLLSIPLKMSVSYKVGKNTKAIKEYIVNQSRQDKETNQLALFDQRYLFTGIK